MNSPSFELFTIEEAFWRVGQSRIRGCLIVSCPGESVHLFMDQGHVTCALAGKLQGGAAVTRALQMEGGFYSWIPDAEPVIKNVNLNVHELSLTHAIARDVHLNYSAQTTACQLRQDTQKLPNPGKIRGSGGRKEETGAHYFLTPQGKSEIRYALRHASVIGRDESCDVPLSVPDISRKHCLAEISERGLLYVKDLGSSNGTYINRELIAYGELRPGDTLTLGTFSLTLLADKTSPVAI